MAESECLYPVSIYLCATDILMPSLPCPNKDYLTVTLSKNGISKTKQVHRLLAQAYIPNPENKATVNQIDGDKLNNNLQNLEWATYSENAFHAYKTVYTSLTNAKDGLSSTPVAG